MRELDARAERRAMRRRRARDGGNAAVEFALAAPIFLTLVLGLADYATMANQMTALVAASRAGAEYARTHPNATAAQLSVLADLPAGATFSTSTSCTCANNTWPAGSTCPPTGSSPCNVNGDGNVFEYITVAATISTYQPLFSYTNFFLPSSLSGTATVRIQ